MKTVKWICRYVFFALLLAICVLWCVFCHRSIVSLEATTASVAFIDLAERSIADADAMLTRLERYNALYDAGIIAGIAVLAALVLLIVWHALSGVLKKKLAERSAAKAAAREAAAQKAAQEAELAAQKAAQEAELAAQKAAQEASRSDSPGEPDKGPGYCPYCGAYYAVKESFCAECGQKL